MEDFYFYLVNNYTLSGEAKRIVDNILQYVADNFENEDGTLEEAGINLIDNILSSSIGLTKEEINTNWGYTL